MINNYTGMHDYRWLEGWAMVEPRLFSFHGLCEFRAVYYGPRIRPSRKILRYGTKDGTQKQVIMINKTINLSRNKK